MVYAVIFDLDGVLVDSYRAHYESWRDVAAEEGIRISEEQFARTFGRTSREAVPMLWPVQSVSEERVREIDERKEVVFREIISRRFPIMDGAPALLRSLRAEGFRLAVGSSAPPENVELALREIGGRDLFDAVVNGMDVERGKPDPQVFLLAAERAGVSPARCAVVEDAVPGIEAARRAGMASVAFVSTGRKAEDFASHAPDLIVRSLRDLSPRVFRALIDRNAQRR